MLISFEEAHARFVYQPDTGLLLRKGSLEEAGFEYTNHIGKKYRRVNIQNKMHAVHRLVWMMNTGNYPKDQIDHIDGDGLNNRMSNLREVTELQNCRNRKLIYTNRSGVSGVHWSNVRQKWVATISDGKRQITLGRFDDINSAVMARWGAEQRLGYFKNHGSDRPL